ncbi:phosphotransferase family protein [Amycolatopsis sp. K13G38]|uniref:Phosphotransferase family protein n=1 Tax=Amycolatopsis acididurans TaxID=2724524 RepID=A0ABX1IX27_9PSEU|nr:phosphotransferase family protein [Amycolatopsis acididurans]NKQ51884.1 phosphotransferase family protein [Amycolatopsis acididurans]
MLDENELLARLRAFWPGSEVGGLRPLPGGVSSLTFAATVQPDRHIVVKVAPPGLAPVKNRDVLRQARILRLLAGTGVPVPAVLGEDAAMPPLFAMTFEAGQSYEPHLDVTGDPPTPDTVTARALAAARTLARLQQVPPPDEEPIPLRDELDRWAKLLATVEDGIAPGHADLHARLASGIPEGAVPTVVHGDYRLANMLFTGEYLRAIIDWEIWSVGDPRTDLAWLLMHTDPRHRFHEQRGEADRKAGTGMPALPRLLDGYLDAGGKEPAALGWFLAYCYYKTAATIAVFVKRNRRREEPDPHLVTAAASLAAVVERGHTALDQSK